MNVVYREINSASWRYWTAAGGFALLALQHPASDRGSLGRFLAAARNGTGGSLVQSTSATNGRTLFTSPLTLVVLGAVILIVFVLLRPTGGLKRLFGIYPAMRAALIGIAVASGLAGFLDGVAFNVAGAAAATAVPLATLAALRVLDHADDRTIVTGTLAALAADRIFDVNIRSSRIARITA